MKQYRYTSANFAPQEPAIEDAFIDAEDLARIKQLAGINETRDNLTQGSNISVTGMEKRQLEIQNNIKPGTEEWFKLWFSRPYLTGEKPV